MKAIAAFTSLLLATLLLLSACTTLARVPPKGDATPLPAHRAETIWVLDSGWHSGLILKRAALGTELDALLQPGSETKYVMFGWGNRRFYMAPAPTLGMDIAALFPSKSALLVEGCDQPPRACYTSAVKIMPLGITRRGLQRLDAYLLQSFQRNASGRLDALGPGPDAGSVFYASDLTYDAFHTCNTWTAAALQSAGVPISDGGVIFADQLWRELQAAQT